MPARVVAAARVTPSAGALGAGSAVVVGLVNNMPDAAIRATEKQFLAILDAASGVLDVEVRLLSVPGVPRSRTARDELLAAYTCVETLAPGEVDALIVTGTEPRTERLEDEAYWPAFTRLVEWAERNTASTVFSCLAAHAAALHLDGLHRRRLPAKLSGVFSCRRQADHGLLADVPASWRVPHSRLNELATADIAAAGYRVLATSTEAGADTFVREGRSLLVFLQGHPEYDAQSLLREYLRDIIRFLRREHANWPDLPRNYLDDASAAAFAELRVLAHAGGGVERQAGETAALAERALANTWRQDAARIYGNWLRLVARKKAHAVEDQETIAIRGDAARGPAGAQSLVAM